MDAENPYKTDPSKLAEMTTSPGEVEDRAPRPEPPPVNLQHIRVSEVSGPLVIFFGPREIGKTVTLVRLCNYLQKYEIRPNVSFRTDTDAYQRTIDQFQMLRQDSNFAPNLTGIIDFLLLDVVENGNAFCQILEAPGEHFFDPKQPQKDYPAYFHQILNSDYKKVFCFFFQLNMFTSDEDRRNYANKIANLASDKIRSKTDRVVIICNKVDLNPHVRNGNPVVKEYKKALYQTEAFKKLLNVLRQGGYGRVPFVPFSAGAFVPDGTGRRAFAPSPTIYPKKLWQDIYDCIEGTPWWKFWL